VPVAVTCIPSYLEGWGQEDWGSRPAQATSFWDPISKIIRAKWTGGMAQSSRVPTLYEALSSNPSPTKKKKKTQTKRNPAGECLWQLNSEKVLSFNKWMNRYFYTKEYYNYLDDSQGNYAEREKPVPKGYNTAWFHVYRSLEMTKLELWRTDQCWSGVRDVEVRDIDKCVIKGQPEGSLWCWNFAVFWQ
jgi:hypothetical protein